MRSTQMPGTELSDYAETLLARQLSQIDGVGQIYITGQQRPAIRVQASVDKLAAIGLTLADVRLANANNRLAANGALIQGSDVTLIAGNDPNNAGTLRASNNLSAKAGNDVINTGLIEAVHWLLPGRCGFRYSRNCSTIPL